MRFVTLLGYTQEELEHYFSDHLARLCVTHGVSQEAMLARIRFWYDGYSWDGRQRVYVPFSTLVFLEQQQFANFWFSTATPTFLIKLLKQQKIPATALADVIADRRLLESAAVADLRPTSLLFQTGYLTIKSVQFRLGQPRYRLGYPNFEVEQAFQQYLLADYLDVSVDQLVDSLLVHLEDALAEQDIPRFVQIFQSVFACIPYTLFLEEEAYYHSIVYLVLRLLNFQIDPEKLTNVGRIDAVLELDDVIYILEFKMSTADIALQQIRDKGYAQSYQGSGKTIILVGIAFDKEKRNITDWQSERV